MQRKAAGAKHQEDKDHEFQSLDHDGEEIDKPVVGKHSADDVEEEDQDQQSKRDIKLRPVAHNFGKDQTNKEECDEGGGEVHYLRIAEWGSGVERPEIL